MSERRRRGNTPGLDLPAGRLAGKHHPNPAPRLDEADGPPPATRCRKCAGEIPHEQRHHRDVDDYVVWFCSEKCEQSWPGDPADG